MSRSKVFAELASQDVSKTVFDTLDTGIPTAGLADNAVTLGKMAPGADGSLITYDADQDPELVPPGTTGHVLTSRGNASTPTFQAAAGAAAATALSDYEAGTWTPIIGGTGGTSGQSYTSARNGRYVKIGALVMLEFYITLSAKGTITSDAMIGGFPFNTSNTFTGGAGMGMWNDMGANQHWCGMYMPNNVAFAYLTYETTAATAGNTSATLMTTSNIGNSTRLVGSITYRTDA